MPKNEGLNRNQQKAIAALLSNRTIAEAAAACGLAERTIYNYLSDSAFKAALAEAEAAALAQVARTMAAGADKAAGALLDVIDDPKATNKEKTAAARAFLSALPTIRLLGSVEARLAELEIAE